MTRSPRYFGEWDCPATDGVDLEPVPVGETCDYGCGRPIGEDDAGCLLARLDTAQLTWTIWHRECFLRNVGIYELVTGTADA